MKRIAAVFAALIIAVCSFSTVGAVPTDESSVAVSETQSSTESQTSKTTDVSQNSENSNTNVESQVSQEEITYRKYTVKDKNFEIALPSSMYVLTRDMDENDPALSACKTTKEEINKSFAETDTYIRACSKDFSYDITIDIVSNESTREIDNLAALTETELESLKSSVLEQGVFSDCTRTVYGKHLFFDLTFVQQLNDTQVYGMQEYTIVGGQKYTITFQSYNTPIDDKHKAIMKTIMESLTISSSSIIDEEKNILQTSSNTKTSANLFNSRKFLVIAGLSIVGIAIFTALVALTIKAKHNKTLEEEKTDLSSNVEPVKLDIPKETVSVEKPQIETSETESQKTSKVSDDTQKILADIQSKANAITSDIIEGNTQKRLQPVKTETAKKPEKTESSTVIKSAEKAKTNGEEKTKEKEQSVTPIQTVSETKDEPVSEYEKRFGKTRMQTAVQPIVAQTQQIEKKKDAEIQLVQKPENKQQKQIDEIQGFFRSTSTVKNSETSQTSVEEVTKKQSSTTVSEQEKKVETAKGEVTKPFEPVKPVADKKPAESTKTSEPTKPVADKKPAELAKAPEPTKPVADKKPAESAKTSEPTKPVADKKPAESTKTSEPTKPVADKKPAESTKTSEPTKPVADKKSAELAKATEPTKPVADKKPAESTKATEPTKPVADKKPAESTKAPEPTKPVADKKPAESTKAPEPTKPVADKKPAESTKTPEPTKPVADKKPAESTKTSEPTKPVADKKPAESAKATEPIKSVTKQKLADTNEQTIKSEGEKMYENEELSEYEKRFGKNRITPSNVTPIAPSEMPLEQSQEPIDEVLLEQSTEAKIENDGEQEFFDGVVYHTEPEQPLDEHTRFEKLTGIRFEEGIFVSSESVKQVMPANIIPRLESVKADEYNRQMELKRKTRNIVSSSPQKAQSSEPPTYTPKQPPQDDDMTIYSRTGGSMPEETPSESSGFIQNLKKKILK